MGDRLARFMENCHGESKAFLNTAMRVKREVATGEGKDVSMRETDSFTHYMRSSSLSFKAMYIHTEIIIAKHCKYKDWTLS